jgi:hypothetical protein
MSRVQGMAEKRQRKMMVLPEFTVALRMRFLMRWFGPLSLV